MSFISSNPNVYPSLISLLLIVIKICEGLAVLIRLGASLPFNMSYNAISMFEI